MDKLQKLVLKHKDGTSEFIIKDENAPAFDEKQAKTEKEKSQARENMGAASGDEFTVFRNAIVEQPGNILAINEENFHNFSPNLSAPTIVFRGDGFEFTRGQGSNYSIAFTFPTVQGTSYDLSFNLESGNLLMGRIGVNDNYPNAPEHQPNSGVVEFSTNNGLHEYSFTATGSEMMLYFAVRYDSPTFKVNSVSCIPAGATADTKIKESAMPEAFKNVFLNTEELEDLRRGADGAIYDTAGDAVRSQIDKINDGINAVVEQPVNLLAISEENYRNLSTSTAAPTVAFNGDGFEFTRGAASNYGIVFSFATESGKSYDLSFNFERGTILNGGVANNGEYPNPLPYIPSTHLVDFTVDNGIKECSFTATGSETVLFFTVAYNSATVKVSDVFCVPAGASTSTRIKESALPESFKDIATNTRTIGERITFVDDASDFTETAIAVRTDGVRVQKNRRPSTGYIDLKGCTSIRFGLNQYRESASEVYNVISFYDKDKAYISGLPSTANGYMESLICVPENAAYVVGSWFEGLTDTPYMTGIYDDGFTEQINGLKAADPLNANQEEQIVNPSMTLPQFVSSINAQWEAYAAVCKCVPWCFMPIRYTDSSAKPVPFADMCEVINKNFRAEVVSPNFSFAENCNRINNAFKKPIYRFADAKLNTKDTSDFVVNMKDIVDFSLDTGMAKVEPSVIVSDDGNTMYIYAYNYRISTTDGVNWTEPTPIVMSGHNGLVHVNVNYIDGIYYLLGCDKNIGGTFGMMTSTDGINFTYQGAIFPESHQFPSGKPVQQWGNSCIMKEYGSNTYYMYVEYRTDMNSGWEIGVVTAIDLTTANDNGTIGNWQNPTSNPIMSKLWLDLDGVASVGAGNPDFAKGEDNRPVKANGRYFMFVHSTHYNNPNISGLATFSSGQSNVLRLSSENLLDWEVDGLMLDNRDIPEEDNPAEGIATSGNADHCIIQFKGRTYLFYSWNINHQTSGRAEYVHYMIDDRPIREILAIRP